MAIHAYFFPGAGTIVKKLLSGIYRALAGEVGARAL